MPSTAQHDLLGLVLLATACVLCLVLSWACGCKTRHDARVREREEGADVGGEEGRGEERRDMGMDRGGDEEAGGDREKRVRE